MYILLLVLFPFLFSFLASLVLVVNVRLSLLINPKKISKTKKLSIAKQKRRLLIVSIAAKKLINKTNCNSSQSPKDSRII